MDSRLWEVKRVTGMDGFMGQNICHISDRAVRIFILMNAQMQNTGQAKEKSLLLNFLTIWYKSKTVISCTKALNNWARLISFEVIISFLNGVKIICL